jgi:hypothetical protein
MKKKSPWILHFQGPDKFINNMLLSIVAILVPVVVALFLAFCAKPLHQFILHPDIPEHMKGKETTLIPNLLSQEEARALNDLMKNFKILNSNLADSKVTRPLHEHIGEAGEWERF